MKKSLKTLALASLGLLTLTACSYLPLLNEGEAIKPSSSSSAAISSPANPVATISQDDAIKVALEQLGLTQDQVTNLIVEPGTEGNKSVYDVSFIHDDMEYEYTIDGQTGQPVEKETERTEATVASNLSADEAKAVAIQDFSSVYGVGEENVSNLAVEQSTDEGLTVYEVSFVYDSMSFDYEVDANTGAIVAFDQGDLD